MLIQLVFQNIQWGPFFHPFFAGALFCTVFAPPKKLKKGHSRISEEKMTKISDFVFFIWVIFLQKREIFAYFCLFFQIFYVLTPGANATQGPWANLAFLRPEFFFLYCERLRKDILIKNYYLLNLKSLVN